MTRENPLSSGSRPPAEPVTDFDLERYRLGELPPKETEALRLRLSADAALKERLRTLELRDAAFAESHPAERWVPRIADAAGRNPDPVARPKPARREKPAGGFSRLTGGFWDYRRFFDDRRMRFAFGFAVLVLAALPVWLRQSPEEKDGTRLKGQSAELKLYRKTDTGAAPLSPDARVKAGDAIQIRFHPGLYAFAAVFSVDGNGSVTRHWPTRPDGNSRISSLPGFLLPNAFQLDSAPRFERFYLFLSQDSLDLVSLGANLAESSRHEVGWLARNLGKAGQGGQGESGGKAGHGIQVLAFPLLKAP
jgi:hypothetical protein